VPVELVVFCGKGGVGKSTLAVGTALALARAERRVLVVSSHPIEELALSLSLHGLEERDAAVASRFYVVHVDPLQVLESLVRSRVHPGRLADLLLGSRVYQSFVRVVPALKEFAFLWKLHELARVPPAGAKLPFEFLIWDAPATGHFLETLRASVNFESFFVGPLAEQGAAISEFFRTARLEIFPVCVAEEMSVDETFELIDSLRGLAISPSAVACNLLSPVLGFRETGVSIPQTWGALGAFVEERSREEQHQFERLQGSARCTVIPVHRVTRDEADLDFLLRIAAEVASNGLVETLEEQNPVIDGSHRAEGRTG
jgi:anion-transporting  ArsA/GET3 family ATPase